MSEIRKSNWYRRLYALSEALFLALAGAYLLYKISKSSTFRFTWPSHTDTVLLVGLAVVAAFRLLVRPHRNRETVVAVGLALVYCMVYRSDKYRFLLFMAALTAGCVDIDYRKILSTWMLTVGTMYAVILLAGMTHAIPNYIRIKDGLRSSWGMCYPTDFATFGLFVMMTLWVTCKRLPDLAMLPLAAGSVALSWFIAHSYTSTVCGLLLCVAILYRILEERVIGARPRLRQISKGIDCLTTVLFPLCAAIVFAMMALYARGTDIAYSVNHLTSHRLEYMVKMWERIGVTAFGTPFSLGGDGFSNFPPLDYTFVDSTYPLIVLRYGVVLFVCCCLFWGWMVRKAVRAGDRRLVLVMGIVAIHCLTEHHFIECHYNILATMPLATICARPLLSEAGAKRAGRRARRSRAVSSKGTVVVAGLVTALAVGVALYIRGPALLSWFKTVMEINGLCGGRATGFALAGCALALLCLCAATVMGLYGVARSLASRASARGYRIPVAVLLVSAILWAGAWVYADRRIDSATGTYAQMLEDDREALKLATDSASGGVYSGIMPAVYRRDDAGISYAAFFNDDLSRLHGSTALMDAKSEHSAFFDSGCLYVQISEAHALYTSDQSVIKALTDAGYHLTGYYSTPKEVNLASAAKTYKLKYSEDRGVLLRTKKQSLNKGPYVNLYAGQYTVAYELSLPKSAPEEDGLVCTLSVTSYKGKKVLLEKEIRRNQFDDDGKLTVSIPFTIGDSRSVAFRVSIGKGRKVYVKRIGYRRTPDYDVHSVYDEKLRLVRREYYTLDGDATLVAGGYFAVEYGYDSHKNTNLIRYFNQDGAPTLHTSGYAEVRRAFNANRKIVREEYFGTDGRPIALKNGEAAVEREYDAAGNNTVVRFYGVDGNPVITKGGYASVRREFDEDGKKVNEEYFGIDGEPVSLSTGQNNIEQDYDEAGNVVARRFYGQDGKPQLRSEGYAEVRWQYNGMHQIVREEFFDAEGEPVLIKSGYWADERDYDDAGNVTVYRYYGVDGQPVKIKGGYAELRRAYDGRRKVVREEYYGVDGQPASLAAGYCALENDYDDVGNVAVRRFYGPDGALKLRTEGYAEVHWRYNDMRSVIREEFYGTDGRPIRITTGQAANEREYDEAGNVTVYRYFGTDGKPAVIVSGYAEVHRSYNEQRQVVREEYYDTDGSPMVQPEGHCAVEQEFDGMGNVSVRRYYDGDGRPVVTSDGCAEVRRVYNNKRQVIREEYYDTDGSPMIRSAGHSAIEQAYDDGGALALRRYLDAQGNPTQRVDGYAEARWAPDQYGVRCVTFYDLDGNAVPTEGLNLVLDAPDGWSRWYTLDTDKSATGFKIADMNLGRKDALDSYSCQVEIEFSGVGATEGRDFIFQSQGSVDGFTNIMNVWNDALIKLTEPPLDGVYRFEWTQALDESNAASEVFNIGFRYDYWAGGSFRVRSLKVERGDRATAWSPGI